MPFVRLIEPGFEKLTGLFGQYEFKDGVSVAELTDREAAVICGILRAETTEGVNVSASAKMLNEGNIPAVSVPEMKRGNSDEPEAAVESDEVESDEVETEEVIEASDDDKDYTFDELAAIADSKGIDGIRNIAKPRGVKGRSINELIEGILKQQLSKNDPSENKE